jgi:adenylate cyclase
MSAPTPTPIAARIHKARHDLRNPLSDIIGFSEILQEETTEHGRPELAADLHEIRQLANALLKELNETLTLDGLSRASAPLADLRSHISVFSEKVAHLVQTLINRARLLSGEPYIEDLHRIGDAARHMRERAPALLGDLFESERQAQGPQLLGGAIPDSEAEVAGDTIFLRKPTGNTTSFVRSASSVAPSPLQTERARILVVDDNEANRVLLTRRLGRNGHLIAQAEDGERALTMLTGSSYDLVLLDVLMPRLNGHEVLAAMRMDRTLRHIPVIMISGLDDLDSLIRCIQAGAEDYLTKPFDPVLLDARIGACLEKKRLRDREISHLRTIEEEKRRADELLHVILPQSIAAELKTTNAVRPHRHENVAILFSDVVDFTSYCDQNEPEIVTEHLQSLVLACEEIAAAHGLEKIKTIGDAFMAAAGLTVLADNPALQCVQAGLEMVEAARSLPCRWKVHVGVHIGPVIAGVVGRRKYMYDVWGDTVNTAARVAGSATPGSVFVSREVWEQVQDCLGGRSAGVQKIKGKGSLELFVIERPEEKDGHFWR